jgi:hypothetical protein
MTQEDEARRVLESVQSVGREVNVLGDGNYVPPKGIPILDLPPEAKTYKVDMPTKQTDLLVGYERRYIIPVALLVAPIFGTEAKPDDIYRALPAYAKNNLHVIYSRSGVTRRDKVLNWDAIVVTVQQLCVVRLNCDLDPVQDKFVIRALYLWSHRKQGYEMVRDPQQGPVDPSVLPYILDRYAAIEGIR